MGCRAGGLVVVTDSGLTDQPRQASQTLPIHLRSSQTALSEVRLRRSQMFLAVALSSASADAV